MASSKLNLNGGLFRNVWYGHLGLFEASHMHVIRWRSYTSPFSCFQSKRVDR